MTRIPLYDGRRTYRAVIHYATKTGLTLHLTSDWFVDKTHAVEITQDFEPTTDEYGGIFDTTIETRIEGGYNE